MDVLPEAEFVDQGAGRGPGRPAGQILGRRTGLGAGHGGGSAGTADGVLGCHALIAADGIRFGRDVRLAVARFHRKALHNWRGRRRQRRRKRLATTRRRPCTIRLSGQVAPNRVARKGFAALVGMRAPLVRQRLELVRGGPVTRDVHISRPATELRRVSIVV